MTNKAKETQLTRQSNITQRNTGLPQDQDEDQALADAVNTPVKLVAPNGMGVGRAPACDACERRGTRLRNRVLVGRETSEPGSLESSDFFLPWPWGVCRSAENNGALDRPSTKPGTRVRALRSCFLEILNSCTVNLVCTSKCTSKFSVVIFPLFWGPGVGLAPLPL